MKQLFETFLGSRGLMLSVLALANGWQARRAWRHARRARVERGGLRRIRSARSNQAVCEAMAGALRANAIVVECPQGKAIVVAGAPWKAALQPLDEIAVDLSFRTRRPSGAGTRHSALSDWLFVPVIARGRVAAVLGLAGRYCRRTFVLEEEQLIQVAAACLGEIYAETTGREMTAARR
jgi:K+-sensing histidine kinase KdpD